MKTESFCGVRSAETRVRACVRQTVYDVTLAAEAARKYEICLELLPLLLMLMYKWHEEWQYDQSIFSSFCTPLTLIKTDSSSNAHRPSHCQRQNCAPCMGGDWVYETRYNVEVKIRRKN